jgi:hypothetical protein
VTSELGVPLYDHRKWKWHGLSDAGAGRIVERPTPAD